MQQVADQLLTLLRERPVASIADIVSACDCSPGDAMVAIKHLVRNGYLGRDAAGYCLTRDGEQAPDAGRRPKRGPAGPRSDAMLQRMWQSMRIRRRFGIEGILDDALRQTDRHPRRLVMTYIRPLTLAGYLIELPRPPTGGRVWQLVRDTGPLAPTVRRLAGVVHDNNTGEDFPC